jgi:hypothetical protein
MATEKVKHQELILSLKDVGFTDASIALGIASIIPGTPIPSINSIRRWRYGSVKPSPYYAALLETFYKEVVSQGMIKKGEQNDK